MSDHLNTAANILALATQLALFIGALIAVPGLFRKMNELHISLNSRLDQFIASEKRLAVSDERAAVAAKTSEQASER